LLGAAALVWGSSQPRRFDKLSTASNLILVGALFVPFITSVAMSAGFVAIALTHDFWLTTVARTVTNTFATLTLVPLICSAAEWLRKTPKAPSLAAIAEVAVVSVGLIAVSAYVFVVPREGHAHFPALLYAPLPLQLWATVRYG